MSQLIKEHQWIYVVVQDPEKETQYLGQYEPDTDIAFIPVFIEKEDALMCLNLLVKDNRRKYEIQAVMFEELAEQARSGGFQLYVLANDGAIREKIAT